MPKDSIFSRLYKGMISVLNILGEFTRVLLEQVVIIPDVWRLVSLAQEITESCKQYMHLTPEYYSDTFERAR